MAPRKKQPSLDELLRESKRLRQRSDELSEEARTLSDKIAAMEMAEQASAARRDSQQQDQRKA